MGWNHEMIVILFINIHQEFILHCIPTESHYMLLKINVETLKNDIDFYFDAFCANCVFTPNLILPEYISKFKEGYLLGGDKFKIIKTF